MTNADPPSGGKSPETTPEASTEAQGESSQDDSLAPMDFSTFLMSLASSAMVTLGRLPAPGSDAPDRDLTAAKQIIDILGILETKTQGNLDASESKLLQSLLYDLRVQYVDASKES